MWKTETLDQSMSFSRASAARNESCELPVAMMMLAEPFCAMAFWITVAASAAAGAPHLFIVLVDIDRQRVDLGLVDRWC